MKVAIIQFRDPIVIGMPNTLCRMLSVCLPVEVWHKDPLPNDAEAVIVPGGFSFGDYFRCGAIARFSPIMADLKRFADQGGQVLGIAMAFKYFANRSSSRCIGAEIIAWNSAA